MPQPTNSLNTSLQNVEEPTRIETDKYVFHLVPRISATKLAEYVVADPSRKETIVKQAKCASKAIILHYRHVRNAFPDALRPEGISSEFLNLRAGEVESSEFHTPWQESDQKRSASALRKLADIADKIDCKNAKKIHRAWGPLKIEGVRVSVQPELVFASEHRGATKIGAVILNTGESENLSLARRAEKFCVGDYLAALVYRMLDSQWKAVGTPLHSRCYAVDIFRGKVYTAPSAHKTMLKHIEASCRAIALLWPTIPLEIDEAESLVVGAE